MGKYVYKHIPVRVDTWKRLKILEIELSDELNPPVRLSDIIDYLIQYYYKTKKGVSNE